jgi:hypothetical protein
MWVQRIHAWQQGPLPSSVLICLPISLSISLLTASQWMFQIKVKMTVLCSHYVRFVYQIFVWAATYYISYHSQIRNLDINSDCCVVVHSTKFLDYRLNVVGVTHTSEVYVVSMLVWYVVENYRYDLLDSWCSYEVKYKFVQNLRHEHMQTWAHKHIFPYKIWKEGGKGLFNVIQILFDNVAFNYLYYLL